MHSCFHWIKSEFADPEVGLNDLKERVYSEAENGAWDGIMVGIVVGVVCVVFGAIRALGWVAEGIEEWFVSGIEGGLVVVEGFGTEVEEGGVGMVGGALVVAAFGCSSFSVNAVRVERMVVWLCWISTKRWS